MGLSLRREQGPDASLLLQEKGDLTGLEEDAMRRDSKVGRGAEEVTAFGLDTMEQVMRERVRATIEAIVEEEVEAQDLGRRQ